MKNAAFVAMLLAGTTSGWADLTVVQTIEPKTGSAKPSAISMTMRIKDSKARLDFKPESHASVIDLRSGKIYLLDHAAKQVVVMPMAQMKAAMAMAGQAAGGAGEKTAPQKTGNAKIINGFKCQEYIRPAGAAGAGRATFWMAEDIDARELDPFREFALTSAKVTGLEAMAQLKGMLIASEIETTFQGETTRSRLEVQSLNREPIDEAIFALPADYRTIEFPLLPPSPSPAPSKPPAGPAG